MKEVKTATAEVQVRLVVMRLEGEKAYGGVPVGFIPTQLGES